MRGWFLAVSALLLLAPLVNAGSAADPEVTDPTGDGSPADPEAARDLVAAYVEHLPESGVFRFHGVLAAAPTHVFPSLNLEQEVIRIGFVPSGLGLEAGQESYLRIRFAVDATGSPGADITSCRYGVAAVDGWQDITEQLEMAAGEDGADLWCDVPEATLGFDPAAAFSVADLHADAMFLLRGPLSGDTGAPGTGGDLFGVREVHKYDRAPDSGFGRLFMTAPAAPAVEYLDVAGELLFENATAEATDRVVQVNWTASGPVGGFSLDVEGAEGVLRVAFEAAGQTLFSCDCNGSVQESWTMPEGLAVTPMNLTLRLEWVGFQGSVRVASLPAPVAPVDGNGTVAPDGMEAGNETLDASADARDSPGAGLVLVVGVVVVAAVLRRR